jgi:hypothetical protein
MERLTEAKAGFRSLTEAIDTTTPAGRMMMQMVGSFAEFERAMLRERTKVGLDSARREGRIGGRRPKLSPQQQAEIRRMVSRGGKPRLMLPGYSESTQPPSVGSSHVRLPHPQEGQTCQIMLTILRQIIESDSIPASASTAVALRMTRYLAPVFRQSAGCRSGRKPRGFKSVR